MNRTFKIIPPLSKKLMRPLVGSGRVSRRIIANPFRKKKKPQMQNNQLSRMLQNRMSHFDDQITNKTAKQQVPFKTASAKIIFHYWNGLGHPFVHHRPELNKINAMAAHRINKHLPKYGKEKIIYAIKIAHQTFSAFWFKYRHRMTTAKISLPDFFKYPESKFKSIKNCPDMPRSWFKECLKGERYLEQAYSVKIKDNNPKITKQLIIIWGVYNKHDRVSTRDGNNLIKCGQLLIDFAKKNNIDPLSLVDIINCSLNKWRTYRPKHSNYLINNIFWQEQLPKELVRYGLFRNLKEIKL